MHLAIDDHVQTGAEALAAARIAALKRAKIFRQVATEGRFEGMYKRTKVAVVEEETTKPKKPEIVERAAVPVGIPIPELVYMEEGGEFEYVTPAPYEIYLQSTERDWLNLSSEGKRCGFREILAFVSVHYGIDSRDLIGPRRPRYLVHPRHIMVWLAREYLRHLSLPQIGRKIGNRDHTTILHSARFIAENVAAGTDLGKEALATEAAFLEAMQLRNIIVEARS